MDYLNTRLARYSDSHCTVYIRKPDDPAFEWSSLGHFLCPAIERSGNRTVRLSNDRDRTNCPVARQDGFGMNKIFFMTLFFIKQSRLASIRNPDTICPGFEW
jgi:hypothetical protein